MTIGPASLIILCTFAHEKRTDFQPGRGAGGETVEERCPSWSKEHDWKSCIGVKSLSWVRIPLAPLVFRVFTTIIGSCAFLPIPFLPRRSSPMPSRLCDAMTEQMEAASRKARRKRHVLRSVAGFLALPLLLLGGASGAYYYQLHKLSESLTISDLPRAQTPEKTRRVLVISPHCDDETLGTGGFIADCAKAGVPVTVVFITNGDGFRVAASRTLREVSVGPDDFVRFAQKRQTEALNADKELGVAHQNVLFLGYPDRGLKPMWEENWQPNHPFRSPYTGHTRSPYARAYHPRALYCGASLLSDLKSVMETVQPTDILVTHPADDHPDHSATSAFVHAALTSCQMKGDEWAADARLRYYIVHRGDWPLPQGSHPDRPLAPPPGLLAHDTRWSAYPVSHDGGAAKARALSRYESQMGISGRFLVSFERTNELLADLPTPSVPFMTAASAAPARVRAERPAGDMSHPRPLLADFWQKATQMPQSGGGDNFARYADPATDLTGVSLRRMGTDNIAVRVSLRGPVSPRVRYRISLRGLPASAGENSDTDAAASRLVSLPVPVPLPKNVNGGKTDASAAAPKNYVEQMVSLQTLGLRPENGGYVWVQAETRWSNRLPLIDRTGYRAFYLPPAPLVTGSGKTSP